MKVMKIDEAIYLSGMSEEKIFNYIEEDWLKPFDLKETYLDEEDLARMRLISQLKDEFEVNDEGVSVILRLIDQLNYLHLEIERLRSTVG